MGRTGLILRQWVERNGNTVSVWQSYAYDTGPIITARIERLTTFKFENEWRAKLCEARMNTHDWEWKKRYWTRYFKYHINPKTKILQTNQGNRPYTDVYIFIVILALIYIALK